MELVMSTPIRTMVGKSLWSVLLVLVAATPGRAIDIIITYVQEDPSPYEANNVTGITLTTLFEAAAAYWEDYLPNSGVYNVRVSWDDDLGEDVLGEASPAGASFFDVDLLADPDPPGESTLTNPAPWFIDTTPDDHSEFDLARVEASSLSQGEINAYFNGSDLPPTLEIGYFGDAVDGGDADEKIDALTVALHELGHCLGVNALSGDSWIPPVSMTGGHLVIIDNPDETDDHLAPPTALMFPSVGRQRTLPSAIDVLAIVDDEDFTMADLPRQSFLQAQDDPSDPDFSWHTGPFFWEGGSQPGTDDHARITNGARVALQTADVQIASLVIAGGSELKTQNRTLLVDGLTEFSSTSALAPTDIFVGAGGSLETIDLNINGGRLFLEGGAVIVNHNANITTPGSQRGEIHAHGTIEVTNRLVNEGQIITAGGALVLTTTSPDSVDVWDLDGKGAGSIIALDGDITVHGSHHGSFDGFMAIDAARAIHLDRPWVMGESGLLSLAGGGGVGAPATLQVDVAEIAGRVAATVGVLDGGEYVFAHTAQLVVSHPLAVLELATLSRFRGVEFFGRGTVRQLSDIVVEAPTTIDEVIFDWGNTASVDVNELTVEPSALLTIKSQSTGTASNEYRGIIRLNNGVMDVQGLPSWTLPTNLGDADGSLGMLVLHNNPEVPTPPTLLGADVTLGGLIRAEGGIGVISADLVAQPTAVIVVQAAAALSLAGHVTYDGPAVHGAGTLHQSGDSTVVSSTTIATNIYDWDGLLLPIPTMTIAPGALLTINSAQIDVGASSADGYGGQVMVADTSALLVNTNGPWRLDGTMTLQGQAVSSPGVIVDGSDLVNHGTIEGNGRIQSSLENHGTLSPGLSAGMLRFQAGFTLTADSVVEIEIGGLTPLTQYDQIIVNQFGSAILSGDLAVSLINGFVPQMDHSFTILTAGLVSGVFDHEIKVGLPPGLTYQVTYNSNSVVLSFLAGLTADFDMDGDVDADDVAQWQDSFGLDAGGDANGDGITDGADFLIIQQQLGGGSPAASAAASAHVGVPEPGVCILLTMGIALGGIVSRRPVR
jgi:hypothetical protein